MLRHCASIYDCATMARNSREEPIDISEDESSDRENTDEETANAIPKETPLPLIKPLPQPVQPQHQATVEEEKQEHGDMISERDEFEEYDQFRWDTEYTSDAFSDSVLKIGKNLPSLLPSPPPPPVAKRSLSKAPVASTPKDRSLQKIISKIPFTLFEGEIFIDDKAADIAQEEEEPNAKETAIFSDSEDDDTSSTQSYESDDENKEDPKFRVLFTTSK